MNYFTITLAALFSLSTAACTPSAHSGGGHGHGHGHGIGGHDEEEDDHHVERGEHGGRLFEKDGFAIEVTIFETGIPPQYRVYAYRDGKKVTPSEVGLRAELTRIGEQVDAVSFSAVDDYLRSDQVVAEPHSFAAKFFANYGGMAFEWGYEQFEGRTEITDTMARESEIVVREVETRTLQLSLAVKGRIHTDAGKTAHIFPRFGGIAKSVYKGYGDAVQRGSHLALIESNTSLSSYAITAPFSGQVIERHIAVGEYLDESREIFTVADLSKVWLLLVVYAKDVDRVQKGQRVWVRHPRKGRVEGVVDYVHVTLDEDTQSTYARVVLDNAERLWRPGAFVDAEIITEEHEVQAAVRSDALQTFRDWQVVFVRYGNLFEVRPVELGAEADGWVEVLSGVQPGERYAAENSFTVKADILKAGASHDH